MTVDYIIVEFVAKINLTINFVDRNEPKVRDYMAVRFVWNSFNPNLSSLSTAFDF